MRGFATWLATHVGSVEVVALDGDRFAAGGLPAQLDGARAPLVAAEVSARIVAATLRRAPRWDAIVSHWLVPCGVAGALVAGRRRHLAIAHGSDVALLRRLPGGASLARTITRRADVVYVADALRLPGVPGRVVPMPAEHPAPPCSPTEQAEVRASAWRTLGLSAVGEAPLVALFLGRLIADKGVDLLLDALPPGVLLLVAGDGPERARLAAHAAVLDGRARLLGSIFGADKARLLAAADVLVVPSRRDGSPTVVAEAKAAGLPILATRVGGLPEALGRAGWLADPSSESLRGVLARLTKIAPPLLKLDPALPVQPTWKDVGPQLWEAPTAPPHDNQLTVIYC